MLTLRIVSRLLDYPDQALFDHHHELIEALEENSGLDLRYRSPLISFIRQLCSRSLLDVQAEYGDLFDRGRATSLLLFEHVHGESRDRGQAMVDLLAQYQADGLTLNSKELPDFLPLYLEYLAQRTPAGISAGLQDVAPVLAVLQARLSQRDSAYALLFEVLVALAEYEQDVTALKINIADEQRDDTPQALDSAWEEEQVRFMANRCSAEPHQRRFADATPPQYLDITITSSPRS